MDDIYTRLYKYSQTASISQLENFLTESLADLFNRLPPDLRGAFLESLLPEACSSLLRQQFIDVERLAAITQFSIKIGASVKRPDMVIFVNDKPLILFEIKVDAVLQEHKIEQDRGLDMEKVKVSVQNQLVTYANWIHSQQAGPWPGAVIFLTSGTKAPEGFENDGSSSGSIIGVTKTWKDVGDWLSRALDFNKSDVTYCALACDLKQFLERNGLMTEFISSRDLAATELFLPSYQALYHTFRSTGLAVSSKYPKSRGGNIHVDFWADMNVFCAWYFLNTKLNPASSKFYIAIGICFPDQKGFAGQNFEKLPQHEPFFFVLFADDWRNRKASEFLTKIPQGWVETGDNLKAAVAKPLGDFEADPDVRVKSLIAWAQEEVGRVVACIPNFESAPVENIPEDPG